MGRAKYDGTCLIKNKVIVVTEIFAENEIENEIRFWFGERSVNREGMNEIKPPPCCFTLGG